MVGQEKVAESSRLAMVSEKEGRQEAVASEVAMEVREVAKEVVVMTSLEAGCKKIGLGCKIGRAVSRGSRWCKLF